MKIFKKFDARQITVSIDQLITAETINPTLGMEADKFNHFKNEFDEFGAVSLPIVVKNDVPSGSDYTYTIISGVEYVIGHQENSDNMIEAIEITDPNFTLDDKFRVLLYSGYFKARSLEATYYALKKAKQYLKDNPEFRSEIDSPNKKLYPQLALLTNESVGRVSQILSMGDDDIERLKNIDTRRTTYSAELESFKTKKAGKKWGSKQSPILKLHCVLSKDNQKIDVEYLGRKISVDEVQLEKSEITLTSGSSPFEIIIRSKNGQDIMPPDESSNNNQ